MKVQCKSMRCSFKRQLLHDSSTQKLKQQLRKAAFARQLHCKNLGNSFTRESLHGSSMQKLKKQLCNSIYATVPCKRYSRASQCKLRTTIPAVRQQVRSGMDHVPKQSKWLNLWRGVSFVLGTRPNKRVVNMDFSVLVLCAQDSAQDLKLQVLGNAQDLRPRLLSWAQGHSRGKIQYCSTRLGCTIEF